MTLKALLVAIGLLPVWKEDRPVTPEKTRQLESIAAAVHRAAKGDPDVAAMTLAIGFHESAYSLRIGVSDCRGRECDPRRLKDGTREYRARGFFQLHRNGLNDSQWGALLGPESFDAQATEAVRRVRSAIATCRSRGMLGAFRAYAGRQCDAPLAGEQARLATFQSIRRRL